MKSLPHIHKSGTVSDPWASVYFLVEINRSVRRMCRLTQTPRLKVFAKVSEPVAFASNCLLVRVLIDNIVFTAIHDNASEDTPKLDVSVWVDEGFAHLEVKREVPKFIIAGRESSVNEQFFRSFIYKRKYNFGVAPVAKALETLKGTMECQLSGPELLLTLHLPNRATFRQTSSSQLPFHTSQTGSRSAL